MAPSTVSARIKRRHIPQKSNSWKKIKLSEDRKWESPNVLRSRNENLLSPMRRKIKTEKQIDPIILKDEPQISRQFNSKLKKPKRRKVPGNKIIKYEDGIPIFVIDEHNGSMVATLRAIELGHCPEKFKFLHFDSHPDLGCINEEEQELIDQCYTGNPSIRKLYKSTDIATWIIPMVIMGHTDYVVWGCAHWCDQFSSGKWTLLCGKDKSDGRMKVGSRGNKKWTCLQYWASGDAVCKEENFEYYREWTLKVIKFRKNGKLPEKQRKSVIDEFSAGWWVLDVDEDFFSCNNPYRDEFSDLFGEEMYSCLAAVYDWWCNQSESEEALKLIYKLELYLLPWKKFSELDLVKELMDNMTGDDEQVELNIRKFHKFVRKTWPNGGFEDSDEEDEEESEGLDYEDHCEEKEREDGKAEEEDLKEKNGDDVHVGRAGLDMTSAVKEELTDSEEEIEEWNVPSFFTLSALHRAGNLTCLPHHVSTANEIKSLANQVESLLIDLPDPAHVTLATSRLDRYLPDSQANVIHGLCEDLLSGLYDTDNIRRLDRPKYSIDNVAIEDQEKIIALDILDICEPEERSFEGS